MFDPDNWARALLVITVGVVSMALLACAVGLVRDTKGHDWYAAGKLGLTELAIGIGFDDTALTEYRTSSGEILSLTRSELTYNGNALYARWYLLRTARKAAELGACCGFGGALLCLALFRRPGDERRFRRPGYQPGVSVGEPPDGPTDSYARRPTGPEVDGDRDSGEGRARTRAGANARQRRGKRDYGRWI